MMNLYQKIILSVCVVFFILGSALWIFSDVSVNNFFEGIILMLLIVSVPGLIIYRFAGLRRNFIQKSVNHRKQKSKK